MSKVEPLSQWLAAERGRNLALCRHVGVRFSYLYQMVEGLRPFPVAKTLQIEEFTGGAVTRADLRPNDWHLIWPEYEPKKAAA